MRKRRGRKEEEEDGNVNAFSGGRRSHFQNSNCVYFTRNRGEVTYVFVPPFLLLPGINPSLTFFSFFFGPLFIWEVGRRAVSEAWLWDFLLLWSLYPPLPQCHLFSPIFSLAHFSPSAHNDSQVPRPFPPFFSDSISVSIPPIPRRERGEEKFDKHDTGRKKVNKLLAISCLLSRQFEKRVKVGERKF